jgi:hypothetical protein
MDQWKNFFPKVTERGAKRLVILTGKCLPYMLSPPLPVPVGSPVWIMKPAARGAWLLVRDHSVGGNSGCLRQDWRKGVGGWGDWEGGGWGASCRRGMRSRAGHLSCFCGISPRHSSWKRTAPRNSGGKMGRCEERGGEGRDCVSLGFFRNTPRGWR